MLKLLIPTCLLLLVGVGILVGCRGNMTYGMTDNMLVSSSQPALAIQPHGDLKLIEACRVELSPSVQGSSLPSTSVQAAYALYQGAPSSPLHLGRTEELDAQSGASRLVALLAITQKNQPWPVTPSMSFPVIRQHKVMLSRYDGLAETFILPANRDPWHNSGFTPSPIWENGSLVRRFTFVRMHKAKVIVEYREPLPQSEGLPLEDNIPLLTGFEDRAQGAFNIINGDIFPLPKPEQKLKYPSDSLSKKELSKYVGELEFLR